MTELYDTPANFDTSAPTRAPSDPAMSMAEEVASLRFDAIGHHARVVAAQCLLDGLGVAIAATNEPAVRIVRDTVLAEVTSGPASLLGIAAHTTATGAALVNGTAAHALDYDDVSRPMGGHPTAPVMPAVLAVGEERGADGRALIAAMVAGIECEARVGASLGDAHYLRGFHTTATAGTLGAAAAAANLLGLSPVETRTALGIAATHAAGLKSMFGTMCKPMHAGKAAASGIRAAKLAAAGFTTAADGITGSQGLLAVLSDDPHPEVLAAPFGQPWHTEYVLFKFHASCYLTHASIEACLQLRAQGLRVRDVDCVDVMATPAHLGVCGIPAPRTGLEGKFSLRFTAALALATGRTDESEFTDAAVADAALVALRDRVRVVTSNELDRYAGHVTVHDRRSRTWQAHGDVGAPRWVDDPNEQATALSAKFDSLVAPVLGDERRRDLRAQLANLPSLSSTDMLTGLTAPVPGSRS